MKSKYIDKKNAEYKTKKEEQLEIERLTKEFEDRGGVVQKIESGITSYEKLNAKSEENRREWNTK